MKFPWTMSTARSKSSSRCTAVATKSLFVLLSLTRTKSYSCMSTWSHVSTKHVRVTFSFFPMINPLPRNSFLVGNPRLLVYSYYLYNRIMVSFKCYTSNNFSRIGRTSMLATLKINSKKTKSNLSPKLIPRVTLETNKNTR